MKSETQNIYNFSMERKNVKETIKKWRLFFIVLAKNKQKKRIGGKLQKYRHFCNCSYFVFTTAAKSQ